VKKTIQLTLQELYDKPKITASVEEAIRSKEDFSRVQPEYCTKICRLKCKSFTNVALNHDEVDVLIVQDHSAYRDGYKDANRLEQTYRNIIAELCRINLEGLTYRITNALKCQVDEEDLTKGNKPPSVITQSKCHPYLQREVELVKPKAIISLGNNATKALGYPKKSNYTHRGEILDSKVVLTLHPKVTTMIRQNASGKLWGPDYWGVISNDFAKAGRIARGELELVPLAQGIEVQKSNIFVTRSIDDVRKVIDEIFTLPENKVISFDTETTGLDRYADDAKLLCIQFGYKVNGRYKAVVIPLWHRENSYYVPSEAWTFVRDLLESNRPKIAHNGRYDILYIHATTGVRVKNLINDTMLALHNLNSGAQGTFSLKTAVWDHLADLNVGGYEDLLPKLTKKVKEEELEDEPE
jgi:uracil-DNA glycosylase family 4